MPDWYRCTDWSEQSEAEFFRRLKRARGQNPQYLVIQALTLVGTGRLELAATALNLIKLFFEDHCEKYFASNAFQVKAEALLMLDRTEEAFEAFEGALVARRELPNVVNNAWLDYPLAVARRPAMGPKCFGGHYEASAVLAPS
jgi:hypothetical protein